MTREQELKAIEDAIKSGRLRHIPMWAVSDWDNRPLRERKAMLFNSVRNSKKMRELIEKE